MRLESSKDLPRKTAHTEKAVNGSERVKPVKLHLNFYVKEEKSNLKIH